MAIDAGAGKQKKKALLLFLLVAVSRCFRETVAPRWSIFNVVDQAAVEARKAGTLPAFPREKAAHEAGANPRPIEENRAITPTGS